MGLIPVRPGETATDGIVVPEGKLASFYWYKADPGLYQAEVAAMKQFYPNFALQQEPDGRLSWIGQVTPRIIGSTLYTLQAVYDHSHPHNETFGGSIKVYCIEPDLETFAENSRIPHTLRDSNGSVYICTARPEDVKAGKAAGSTVTTAAVAISWAVKWITAFELWVNEDLTQEQFESHVI